MRKIVGVFLAFLICMILGLILPWMRDNGVSMTGEYDIGLSGDAR